mmetsp:Transcript_6695/g.23270  ORF Transcript_6695/g.23270 Transcript_6695/m.23270 type:complete len:248 (-) Transcript_6695:281-1024(-)
MPTIDTRALTAPSHAPMMDCSRYLTSLRRRVACSSALARSSVSAIASSSCVSPLRDPMELRGTTLPPLKLPLDMKLKNPRFMSVALPMADFRRWNISSWRRVRARCLQFWAIRSAAAAPCEDTPLATPPAALSLLGLLAICNLVGDGEAASAPPPPVLWLLMLSSGMLGLASSKLPPCDSAPGVSLLTGNMSASTSSPSPSLPPTPSPSWTPTTGSQSTASEPRSRAVVAQQPSLAALHETSPALRS